MRTDIVDLIKGRKADYIEVRLEESEATRISYRGERLEDLSRTSGTGGNVRALVKGGWGFISFNETVNPEQEVALAIKQARLVGKEKSQLGNVDPAVDTVPAEIRKDPASVPLSAKKELLDEYKDIVLSTPGIQTCAINYYDGKKNVLFASSEGARIEQQRVDIGLRISAIAAENGSVQQIGLSTGSLGDYGAIEHLHDEVKDLAQRAVRLLSAPQASGGEYTVVLDPILAGVFVHEAFGHLSESDFVHENKRLREMMVFGRKFGGPHLNIVDGAAVPCLRGSYKYDDEGVPAQKTYLIRSPRAMPVP
jgi:TldD protein